MSGTTSSRRWLGFAVGVLALSLAAATVSPAAAANAAPKTHHVASKVAHHPAAAKIDINTATREQLEKVPGIGPAYAGKIVAGRPYKGKDELLRKKILPKSVYEKAAPHIIAKQSGK